MIDILLLLAMSHCSAKHKQFVSVGFNNDKSVVILCAGNNQHYIPKLLVSDIWIKKKEDKKIIEKPIVEVSELDEF